MATNKKEKKSHIHYWGIPTIFLTGISISLFLGIPSGISLLPFSIGTILGLGFTTMIILESEHPYGLILLIFLIIAIPAGILTVNSITHSPSSFFYTTTVTAHYPNHPNYTMSQACQTFQPHNEGYLNSEPVNSSNLTSCLIQDQIYHCTIKNSTIDCLRYTSSSQIEWKGTIISISKR